METMLWNGMAEEKNSSERFYDNPSKRFRGVELRGRLFSDRPVVGMRKEEGKSRLSFWERERDSTETKTARGNTVCLITLVRKESSGFCFPTY